MKTKSFRVLLLNSVIFLLADSGVAHSDDLDAIAFMYEIVPVNLPGGHQVTGMITTNCNDCALASANIIDYQIKVTGPRPFEFTPNQQGAYAGPFTSVGEVIATPTEIVVPTTPDRGYWGLVFIVNDCTTCIQQVDWAQNTNTAVESSSLYAVLKPSEPRILDHLRLPFADRIVATFVPEPSSVILTIVGGFAWLCCGRRKL